MNISTTVSTSTISNHDIFTTMTLQTQLSSPEYRFPWIIIPYILVMIIAIPGNLLILWITLANKKMRSPIHLLVCNLAVAGLLIAVIRIPIRTNRLLLNTNWYPFSLSICRMAQLIPASCVTSISITLTAICIERYFTIIYPTNLKLRMTPNKVYIFILTCWLASISFWTPYATFMTFNDFNNHTRTCTPDWPRNSEVDLILRNRTTNVIIRYVPISKFMVWMLFIIFVFLIPAIVMITLYSIIVKRLWRTPPGLSRTMSISASRSSASCRRDQIQHENHSLRLKRRVIKICIACVVLFLLTNFPYYSLLVLLDFQLIQLRNYRLIIIVADILILLNYTCIAYNAIIYGYFNKKYRRNAPNWLNIRVKWK